MPSSDYTSAVGGGLKLKGSSGGGIDKKKKKKKKPQQQTSSDDHNLKPSSTISDATSRTIAPTKNLHEKSTLQQRNSALADGEEQEHEREGEDGEGAEEEEQNNSTKEITTLKKNTTTSEEVKTYGKTEAQRRHEERRKKRLEERLQREGVKTHKERVQELNKYLSTLSEHNDMPRIGPG